MKFANFKNSAQMLSASQMKKVKGGSGNCGYRDPNGYGRCDLSKAEAMHMAAAEGYYWCCESCAGNGGSASYC